MKILYVAATLAFWLSVATLWIIGTKSAPYRTTQVLNRYADTDVARHAEPDDCWMTIAGKVYDLSGYLPQHPTSTSVIADWCGKEATNAFETKNADHPHSLYARELLRRYEIGVVDQVK